MPDAPTKPVHYQLFIRSEEGLEPGAESEFVNYGQDFGMIHWFTAYPTSETGPGTSGSGALEITRTWMSLDTDHGGFTLHFVVKNVGNILIQSYEIYWAWVHP